MTPALDNYLGSDAIVEASHPGIMELATRLRAEAPADKDFARDAFNWVRDNVDHSIDVSDPRVTITAGEVLTQRVGLCFAKSHLLAAILRAGGVPAELCYQRLNHNDGFALHGLVAVYLDGRWHRQDPRGNNQDIAAEFSLTEEKLAYQVDPTRGELDYPKIFAHPAPVVVQALAGAKNALDLCTNGLPDSLPED